LLVGGGQEGNFRSGTEGTPAIFGFAAACAAGNETFRADISREKELLDALVEKLSTLDGLVINGAHDAPHILSLSIPGLPTQNSINILQDSQICVSAGSACAKGHRSHTLTAMNLSPEVMDGSFRISLCRDNTDEELDTLAEVLKNEDVGRYIL
jgi:cysteine desulfurase